MGTWTKEIDTYPPVIWDEGIPWDTPGLVWDQEILNWVVETD